MGSALELASLRRSSLWYGHDETPVSMALAEFVPERTDTASEKCGAPQEFLLPAPGHRSPQILKTERSTRTSRAGTKRGILGGAPTRCQQEHPPESADGPPTQRSFPQPQPSAENGLTQEHPRCRISGGAWHPPPPRLGSPAIGTGSGFRQDDLNKNPQGL